MSVNLDVSLTELLADVAYLKKRRAYNNAHAKDYYYRKQAEKYGMTVEEYRSVCRRNGRPKKVQTNE